MNLKKLSKTYRKFLFGLLARQVKDGKLRPFQVDEQGVWFKTGHGFAVFCNFIDRILELEVNPVWEAMETAFVLRNLHEKDVFLDVGANIGYFSMLAAQRKPAKVVSFEPVPRTFRLLTRNIEHNGLGGIVEPINLALGSRECVADSVDALGPKNHIEYAVENSHAELPKVRVRVTTLDKLVIERKLVEKVDFIKVDIEGYEYEFLRGARETIAANRPLILMEVEEHRLVKFGAEAADIFRFLKDLGYRYLCVRDNEIAEATSLERDLAGGRDFVFFAKNHRPAY